MFVGATPANAALVSACAGVTLPTSALNGVLNPLVGTLLPGLGGLLFSNTNINLATQVLGASANPCDATADTVTATTINAGTVNATTVVSNIYQLTPAVNKGISIGGNAITGLGTGVTANAGGLGSIAIGNGALTAVAATNATAIGLAAQADGINGVALGNAAISGAIGQNVAIGAGSTSNATTAAGGAVSIGRGNSATGNGAIAIGDPSVATGQGATAQGFNATATGNGAVAIGNTPTATGQGAIAIGSTTTATGGSSIALGDSAKALGAQAIALGLNSAAAVNSVAAGPTAIAGGTESVAVGNAATAAGNSSVAVGNTTQSGDLATAVGNNITATGQSSVVVGAQSNASGVQSIAIGHFSNTTANNGVAIGQASFVLGNATTQQNSTAIGSNVLATGNSNIGIGTFASSGTGGATFSTGDVAIGMSTTANSGGAGVQATALGSYAQATASNATALGSGGIAAATGTTASALGATALGGNAIAGARATGTNAVAIGGQSAASNTSAIAIGRGATSSGTLGVALGDGATTTVANSVALGSGSTIVAAPIGAAYNVATAAPAAQVEIGGRRITGVSGGSLPTDAVNVSQLAGVAGNINSTVGGSFSAAGVYTPPTYVTANGTTATTVQGALANETQGITNVGVAAATNFGGAAVYNPVTGTISSPNYAVANITATGAVGAPTTATSVGAAVGSLSTDVLNIAGNLNGGTVGTVQRTGVPNALALTAPGGTGIAPGAAQTLGNVAAGVAATDAANVGQLTTAIGSATANAVQYDVVAGVRQNQVSLTGGFSGTVKITNVTPGTLSAASTDAVNGGQLFATNTNVATNTTAITNINNGTTGLVRQVGGAPGTGLITVGAQTAGTTVSVAGTAGNRVVTGVAPGSLAAGSVDAVDGGQVNTLGTSVATNLGGGAAFNPATGAVTAPSYTVGGTAYNNVGAALGAQDTISGAQGTSSAANLGGGAAYNPATGTVSAPSYTVQGTAYNNVGSAFGAVDGSLTNITNGTTGIVQRTGPATNVAVLTATGGTAAAPGAAQQLGNVAAGVAATDAVNVSQLTAVGTLANNSVQYDAPGGVRANSVTLVGVAPGDQVRITNVAPGALTAASTDAVNGGQVNTLGTAVASNLGGGSTFDPATGAVTAPSYLVGGTAYTNVGSAVTALQTGAPVQYATAGAPTTANGLVPSQNVTLVGAAAGPVTLDNVAAGSTAAGSTQAVNGGQLNSGLTSVATNLGGGAAYDPVTGTVTAPSYTIGGTAYGNVGTAFGAVDSSLTSINNGTTGIVQRTGPATNVAVLTATGGTAAAPGAAQVLTNVAPGALTAASTDAVNGSQLFATNTGIGNITNVIGGTYDPTTGGYTGPSYTVLGAPQTTVQGAFNSYNTAITGLTNGTIGLVQQAGPGAPITVGVGTDGTVVNIAGTAGTRTLTGLKDGVNASDAVTVAQINNLTGGQLNVVQYDSSALGNRLNSVTLIGGAAGPVTITNVAAGALTAGSTDAVNGGQINTLGTGLAANLGGGAAFDPATGTVSAPSYTVGGTTYGTVGTAVAALQTGSPVQYATAAAPTTANGLVPSQNVTLVGAAAGPVTLDNVANGSTAAGSTQAVNGGQLNTGLASVATSLGGGATYNATTGAITAPTYTVQGSTYNDTGSAIGAVDASLTNLQTGLNNGTIGLVQQAGGPTAPITVGAATGGTAVNIAGTDGPRTLSGVAAGTAPTDAANVAQVNAVGSVAANSVQYDTVGGVKANSITLAGGAAGPVKITNVAPATLAAGSTDAVNGDQLAATNAQVATNTANIVTNTGNINSILTGQAGAFRADNAAGAAAPVASGANAVAGGFGSSATGARGLALGSSAVSTGTNSVALGAGSTDGGAPNVVSVGSVGGERRITNVGPAVSGTDAVNLSQLQGATTQFQTGLAGVQQSIAGVQFDLNRFKKRANAGTAGAMAVAGLPQAFTPGAGMVAAAVGTWQDQVGFAIGASKIIGDQVVVKAGASFTTRGSGGANAGVGVQF